MSRKRYTPEQIIGMLREAEVALSQGQTVRQACRRDSLFWIWGKDRIRFYL